MTATTDDDDGVPGPRPEGAGLIQLSFAGTGLVAAAATAGVVSPDTFGPLTAVVSGAAFTIGVVMFLWGYAVGVARSRDEQVTLGGLFFLADSAPPQPRFRLRTALAVQVAVAITAASVRPYTSVAFAVLAPILGLGAMALWGARHGEFGPREPR